MEGAVRAHGGTRLPAVGPATVGAVGAGPVGVAATGAGRTVRCRCRATADARRAVKGTSCSQTGNSTASRARTASTGHTQRRGVPTTLNVPEPRPTYPDGIRPK